MKRKITLLMLAIIMSTSGYAFNLDWAQNILASTDGGTLAIDNFGNVFIGGIKADSIIVLKYSASGMLLNSLRLATNNADNQEYVIMGFDSNNNLVIAGMFDGLTDFVPGVGTYTLTGNHTFFLAKYTNDLNSLIFVNPISASRIPLAMVLDNSGTIYATSYKTVAPGYGYIGKYNSNGNVVWEFSLTVTNSSDWVRITGLDVNDSGELFIAGYLHGTGSIPDFDPDSVNIFNNIGGDQFFAKYSTDMTFLWAKGIDVGNDVYPKIKFYNGTFFIASKGYGDVDPNPGVLNMNGNYFVAQYNSSTGDVIWGREINVFNETPGIHDDKVMDMKINSFGDVFICGNFYSGDSIDFNDAETNGSYVTTNGDYIGFVTVYSFNNSYISSFLLPTTQSSYANSLIILSDTIYLGGYYSGITDFDPNSTYNLTASSNPELFLARYYFNQGPVGIHFSEENDVLIYPNPTDCNIYIDYPLWDGRNTVQIELLDVLGNVVFSELVMEFHHIGINLHSIQPGIYILYLHGKENMVINKRIIIE